MDSFNKILWCLSLILFVLGITLPMFSMEKFYLFKDSFSLIGGLYVLIDEGELMLFILIFSFSILMPLIKFNLCYSYVFNKIDSQELKLKQIKKISFIGKWSMADVFVIAVLASTIKVGGFAKVTVHYGLLIFGLSVVLSLILTSRLYSNYELRPKA